MKCRDFGRRSLSVFLVCVGLGALGPTSMVHAAAGDLDPSFGDGGKVTVDFGGIDLAWAVVVQPDGKIVVAGQTQSQAIEDFAIVRLGADGSLDQMFGDGGKVTVDFGALDRGSFGGIGLALQPDGKILIVGETLVGTGNGSFAIVRLRTDGSPDSLFDGDGQVLVDISPLFEPGSEAASDVAIQPDGKVLVMGSTQASETDVAGDFAIARVNATGLLDTSYSPAGIMGVATIGFGDVDTGLAMALQPDGNVVVAGGTLVMGASNFAVARVTPNGDLDLSFGGAPGGRAFFDFGGGNAGFSDEAVIDLSLQPDGKIALVGFSGGDFAVAKLTSGGTPDELFSGDGKTKVDFGNDDRGLAVGTQVDGKTVVAGFMAESGVPLDMAIARLQPDGSLDPAFGAGGKTMVDFGGFDVASELALQPDRKVLVVGASVLGGGQDFAIARLQADPPPNAAFTFAPATPVVGEVVTFDASTSSNPGGSVSEIAWDLDNDGGYENAAGVTATTSFATGGMYPVSVRVTGDNGLQATATQVVPVTCGDAPSFLSVDCRLLELLATVDRQVPAGAVHDKLTAALTLARTHTQLAADAGPGKQARKSLAKARKMVGKFIAGVRKGKKSITEDAVRAALLATARGVRASLKELRKS